MPATDGGHRSRRRSGYRPAGSTGPLPGAAGSAGWRCTRSRRRRRPAGRSGSRPRSSSTASTEDARPSEGRYKAPRMRSGDSNGCRDAASSGGSTVASSPHAMAKLHRRCSSASRSGVVATSSPPTALKAAKPSRVSEESLWTVYAASSAIVREGLVWKTSPGAWEVDPPVSGMEPWSRTVTSAQPRRVSSSARLAPTIPAPMTTTRGVPMSRILRQRSPPATVDRGRRMRQAAPASATSSTSKPPGASR